MTRRNDKPNFKVGTLQGGNKKKCMIADDMCKYNINSARLKPGLAGKKPRK